MPETSCLHIQSRDSDPVRVVDMTNGSVRIGRAAYCDVRLADAALADEECRLRRRGEGWQLVPVARKGSVLLDGRRVDAAITLATDQTFLVGSHRLTLRRSATHAPWADRPIPAAAPVVEPPGRELAATTSLSGDSASASANDRWVHARRETKRWESRWRAAGEKLRATTTIAAAATIPVPPPVIGDRTGRADLLRDVGARRPDVRPARPAVSPAASAVLAPSPAGYLPPAAPATKRRPVTTSDWTTAPAPKRPVPQAVVRPEPLALLRRVEISTEPDALVKPVRPTEETEPEPTTLALAYVPSTEPMAPGAETPLGPGGAAASSPGREPWDTANDPEIEPRRGDRDPGLAPESDDESTIVVDVEWVESREAHAIDSPDLLHFHSHSPSYEDENFDQVLAEATSAPLDVLPRIAAPVPTPTLIERDNDDEDDEENERDEPATARPMLGAARRAERPAPDTDQKRGLHTAEGGCATFSVGQPPSAGADFKSDPYEAEPVWEPVETEPAIRTEPDRFRVGGTRWVAHRPAEVEARAVPVDVEDADDWSYQTPFVTDTNRLESVEELAPAGVRASSGRYRDEDRDGLRRESHGPKGSRSTREWPTVDDIFAAQRVRPAVEVAEARTGRPEPTIVREPDRWRLPLWLAWLPGSALALGVGAVGLTGAAYWAQDAYHAGLVAQRLASAEPAKTPLPADVTPSDGSWMTTSAAHLVQWAAYLDRDTDDPEQTREARALLKRAAMISPLNPTVRYALARPLAGEEVGPALTLARSLGQSRDVPAMAWAGRTLLAAGKRDAALRTFRAALEMAVHADLTRLGVPRFVDDPQVRRYALPTEDLIAGVVREMAGSTAWSYKDWADTLPRGTIAAVVVARVLRESGSPDAANALEAALAEAGSTENASASANLSTAESRQAEAQRLAAAGAEALTMKQRWTDARDRYRQAVDLMPVELIRRAWCINLADLSARLGDDPERQQALEAAKVADLKDEVTRRAVDLQRASGVVARRPISRVAGSPSEESSSGARR